MPTVLNTLIGNCLKKAPITNINNIRIFFKQL